MAVKKYMSLDRLQEYDALIKQEIAKSVSGKANSSHTHDDRYYTETEIDTKIATINNSISGKANSSHSHNAVTTSVSGFMTADMLTKLNGIATGANKTVIDSSLSTSSTNPVQNKLVTAALNSATSAISANTSSINAHTTAINNLQTVISEIQEITSEDVAALFA